MTNPNLPVTGAPGSGTAETASREVRRARVLKMDARLALPWAKEAVGKLKSSERPKAAKYDWILIVWLTKLAKICGTPDKTEIG